MTLSIDQLTYADLAQTIDHSLLPPELDDAFVVDGCHLAAEGTIVGALILRVTGES